MLKQKMKETVRVTKRRSRIFWQPVFSAVVAWVLCCGMGALRLQAADVVDKKPAVQKAGTVLAPSYILMDLDTGRVLAARAEHVRRFPASTTKTLTALVALENKSPDTIVTIGPNPPTVGESSINLQQGETFTLRELLEAALVRSANDSCVAIAEGVAGSEAAFVQMMNKKAREVGALDSHFCNPHGLHNPQHYTTAYDLAMIARAALKHPEFNDIVSMHAASIHGNAKVGPLRSFFNRNRLLLRWNECDGVKTGYTKQAGRCLVATATRMDPRSHRPWRLLSVVMHAPDSWTDSRNLLEYGFSHWKSYSVAHGGDLVAKLDVKGGASQVEAMAAREIRLPLQPQERTNLQTRVRSLEPEAPVRGGQNVAEIEWLLGDRKIGAVPLVAGEDVPLSISARMMPVAGQVLPSKPLLRWTVYLCGLLGILLIATGLKALDNERKREQIRRERQAARRLLG
jgi:D-alanyl-D-alanine carboxypeptidase (penicillin-binding protein 5/6)